jgi:hypothetical protein
MQSGFTSVAATMMIDFFSAPTISASVGDKLIEESSVLFSCGGPFHQRS